MKKALFKVLVVFTALLLLLTGFPATAFADDSDYDITETTDAVTIIGYTGDDETLVIPETINGKPVREIAEWAFSDIYLTSVTLPNNLNKIGNNAFRGCALTSVTIPANVNEITGNPFINCMGLTEIKVDSGNSKFSGEGGVLFKSAQTDLIAFPSGKGTSYTIPDSVQNIKYGAFEGSDLSTVTFGSKVETIEDMAFAHCSLANVNIPDTVKTIGDSAFCYCYELTAFDTGDGLESIGYGILAGCSNLATVDIGRGVTSILSGYGAFEACFDLEDINVDLNNGNYSSSNGVLFNKSKTRLLRYPAGKSGGYEIPEGVTVIDEHAFSSCTKMSYVKLPESLRQIGNYAFSTNNFESVSIPADVTEIGSCAFTEGRVSKAYFYGNAPTMGQDVFFKENEGDTIKIYYAYGKLGYDDDHDGKWLPEGYPVEVFYPNPCTVTFNLNGAPGTAPSDQLMSAGSTAVKPTDPQYTGNSFGGWYTTADCTTPWNFNDPVTANMTLYAKWTANKYKVTFDSQGGSGVPDKEVLFNTAVQEPASPTLQGHTFGGWYTTPNCATPWNFNDPVTANMTLYAKWTINKYKVSFDSQGGSAVSDIEAQYDATISEPLSPTRAGYTFSGWYKEASCVNPWSFSSDKVKSDTKLYAKWADNAKCTIKAAPNKKSYGSVQGAGKYNKGILATLTAIPKSGYRFVKWIEGSKTVGKSYQYTFTAAKDSSFKAEFAAIGKPSLSSAKPLGKNSIKLKWKSVGGAAGYNIYRSTKSGSGFKLVTQVKSTTYTDTGLKSKTKYYYKVKAYCSAGSVITSGGYSNVKNAKTSK
jgi:uncharacterized repeat protein (TIGR02543 family)